MRIYYFLKKSTKSIKMDKTIFTIFYNQMLGKISYEKAKEVVCLEVVKNYFHREFEELFLNKNSEIIEPLIFLPQWFNIQDDFIVYYNKLLIESWHFNHEFLIDRVALFKSNTSTPYIEKAVSINFEYMTLDETNHASFIRKCMYALGDINSPESVEALTKFCKNDNPFIHNFAEEQLKWLDGDQEMRYMP